MDLKNNKITIGELYQNPKALKIFEREFGALVHHPMVRAASGMPLSKLLKLAKNKVEPSQVERILKELEEL